MSEKGQKIPYPLDLPLLEQQVHFTLDQRIDPQLQNDEMQVASTSATNALGKLIDGNTIAFQTSGDGRTGYHDRSRSLTVIEDQKSGQQGAFSIRDGYSESIGLSRKGTLDTHADITLEDKDSGTEVNRYSSVRTVVDRKGKIKHRGHTAHVQKFSQKGTPKGQVSQEYSAKISPRNAERYGHLLTRLARKKAHQHTTWHPSDKKIEKKLPSLIS